MLRISSCTMIVLPTPAPPNSPIFDPLTNVQIRSMTLRPVSRISISVFCSSTAGAGRWIGHSSIPSAVGGVHGQAADGVVPRFLLHLENYLTAVLGSDDQRLHQVWQPSGRELHVHDRADDLADLARHPRRRADINSLLGRLCHRSATPCAGPPPHRRCP